MIIDDCNLSEGDFDKFIQMDMTEEKLEQVVSGSIPESDQTVRSYYDFGIILTVSMMAEDYARFYEYGFWQDQLPDSYYIKRFEIIENNFICVYFNTKMKRDFAKKEKSELVFLSIGITTDDIKHFNTNIWGGGIKTPLLFVVRLHMIQDRQD